jgi:hypothetical protein
MFVSSPCVLYLSFVSSHRITNRPQRDRSNSPSLVSFQTRTANGGYDLHLLARLNLELPGPQEPQHSEGVESLLVSLGLEHRAQLVDGGILLLGGVAWVTRLGGRGNSREVEVRVVFRVEARVLCHCEGCVDCSSRQV